MQFRHLPRIALTLVLVLVLVCAGFGGRMLVINAPERADVIIVLNGGTWARISTGVAMVREGWAPRMILDLDANGESWGVPEDTMARRWIAGLPPPANHQVSTCPTTALSSRSEAQLTRNCLQGAHRVLIVTSAYHTRRALAVFRRMDPGHQYSVAAVEEPAYFGRPWWRHREWVKTTAAEWCKLLWWYAIDRWR